jgi:hypothetical protein
VSLLDDSPVGLRDRALLLTGFACCSADYGMREY